MKIGFPLANENQDTRSVLKSAVQMACDTLTGVYQVDDVKLALLVDILADSILENFRDGQHDAPSLAHLATSRALQHLGYRLQ